MNKAELINSIADRTGIPKKHVERCLNALAEGAVSVLDSGDKIVLPGLGHLEPVSRKARMGRNPRTGAPVDIPASRSAKFQPGKALKDALNA